MRTHNLGYPRIGSRRELKKACEKYRTGKITLEDLLQTGKQIRQENRKLQKDAGIDLIPINDFSYTTIGSFPQTKAVREVRSNLKKSLITQKDYTDFIKTFTEEAVRIQEETGLDVLVHGEFERNDMVEYFGEQMSSLHLFYGILFGCIK
jgi:5-methyltetrahydropteroyltriglutamate--homocysteine methyltransferase